MNIDYYFPFRNNENIEEVWHSCKEEVGIIGFETDVLCGSGKNYSGWIHSSQVIVTCH